MSIKPVLVPDQDAKTLRALLESFDAAATGTAKKQLTESVAEGFPYDVDHMPGPVIRDADMTSDNVKTRDKAYWDRAVNSINARVFDDMAEFRTDSRGESVTGNSAVWAKWDAATETGWFNHKGRPLKIQSVKEQGVAEGSLNEGQYEMMLRNGQVKKFVAKDDADAKRIAAGHGAKSVIRLKGGVPAGKVSEQGVAEAGPFSYSKAPRRGSVADLAAKKRKEQDRKTPAIEPKDQMVGVAKVKQGVAEGKPTETTKLLKPIMIANGAKSMKSGKWPRNIKNGRVDEYRIDVRFDRRDATDQEAAQIVDDVTKALDGAGYNLTKKGVETWWVGYGTLQIRFGILHKDPMADRRSKVPVIIKTIAKKYRPTGRIRCHAYPGQNGGTHYILAFENDAMSKDTELQQQIITELTDALTHAGVILDQSGVEISLKFAPTVRFDFIDLETNEQGLSEGIMDVVKQTFNDNVVGWPMGTSDEQFIQGWADSIKRKTGRDIPVEKLAKLYQDYADRSPEIMRTHSTTNEEQGVAEGIVDTISHGIKGLKRKIKGKPSKDELAQRHRDKGRSYLDRKSSQIMPGFLPGHQDFIDQHKEQVRARKVDALPDYSPSWRDYRAGRYKKPAQDKKPIREQGVSEGTKIAKQMIAEGRIAHFRPPFRVNGNYVDDVRGNTVCEMGQSRDALKDIADALNAWAKQGVAEGRDDDDDIWTSAKSGGPKGLPQGRRGQTGREQSYDWSKKYDDYAPDDEGDDWYDDLDEAVMHRYQAVYSRNGKENSFSVEAPDRTQAIAKAKDMLRGENAQLVSVEEQPYNESLSESIDPLDRIKQLLG